MRTVELNGYIDEEAWFGDEVTPESLHALLYPEGADAQEDLRIIHESPDIPGSPLAIQKDLPQELKDKVKDFLLSYDDPEYFGDEEGVEPKRFIEIADSDYDYLADLKETYNLSD